MQQGFGNPLLHLNSAASAAGFFFQGSKAISWISNSHNKTLSVAGIRVHDPDCSPSGIQRCDAAQTRPRVSSDCQRCFPVIPVIPVPPAVGSDLPATPLPPLTSFTGCRSRILAFLSRRQTECTTLIFGVCSSMTSLGYRIDILLANV